MDNRPRLAAIAGALILASAAADPSTTAPPACTLTIEVQAADRSLLRLRSRQSGGPGGCPVATATLRDTLAAALAAAPPDSTVALGRLIDYPGLACALASAAAADPGWNPRRGRARDGRGDNAWTAAALARPALLGGLMPAGWTLVSVSTEKVLKGVPARWVAGCDVTVNGLPFDAQVWVRVRRW